MRKIGHITRLIPYIEAAAVFNALHLLSLYKGLSLYNIVSVSPRKQNIAGKKAKVLWGCNDPHGFSSSNHLLQMSGQEIPTNSTSDTGVLQKWNVFSFAPKIVSKKSWISFCTPDLPENNIHEGGCIHIFDNGILQECCCLSYLEERRHVVREYYTSILLREHWIQFPIQAKSTADVTINLWRLCILWSVFSHVCSNRSRNLSAPLILSIIVHKFTIRPKEIHYYCVIHLQQSTSLFSKKDPAHLSKSAITIPHSAFQLAVWHNFLPASYCKIKKVLASLWSHFVVLPNKINGEN